MGINLNIKPLQKAPPGPPTTTVSSIGVTTPPVTANLTQPIEVKPPVIKPIETKITTQAPKLPQVEQELDVTKAQTVN